VESVTSLFFCTLSGLDEVAWIKSIGSLLKGGHSRLDLFIMCLAPKLSFFPLEEHLEKQGPFKSGFLCLDNNVREDLDFG